MADDDEIVSEQPSRSEFFDREKRLGGARRGNADAR